MRVVEKTIKVTVKKPDGSEDEKRAGYKCQVAENDKDMHVLAKTLHLDVLDLVNRAYQAKIHSLRTQTFRKHLAGKKVARPDDASLVNLDDLE